MRDPVVEYMKQNPFSLAIDGGSDTGTENMYPLVVRILDKITGEVRSNFWHMWLAAKIGNQSPQLLQLAFQTLYFLGKINSNILLENTKVVEIYYVQI